MVTTTLSCPKCKHQVTVSGEPGEIIKVSCPACSAKGYFTFPQEAPRKQIPIKDSNILYVSNLEYNYPKSEKKAVNNISFNVDKGEIFGFLGPNGAGKSTTQKLIMGLLKNYHGTINILGKNLDLWRSDLYEHIGVCFETPNHYQKLTGLENLNLFASFYKSETKDPNELLKLVDLDKDAKQRVGSYSKGMKTKLNFIRSLLNNPQMLFLDEPTAGLDPVSARQVKNIILEQKNQGTTIFLTTHNMTDADELCDRVGFLVDGNLSLIENPKDLKLRHGRKMVNVEYLKDYALTHEEFNLHGLGKNKQFISILNSGNVQTIHTAEASLEDVFIKVTGRQLK